MLIHLTLAGDEVLLHLARPNPVWTHLEATTEVRLAVIGDWQTTDIGHDRLSRRLWRFGPRPLGTGPIPVCRGGAFLMCLR